MLSDTLSFSFFGVEDADGELGYISGRTALLGRVKGRLPPTVRILVSANMVWPLLVPEFNHSERAAALWDIASCILHELSHAAKFSIMNMICYPDMLRDEQGQPLANSIVTDLLDLGQAIGIIEDQVGPGWKYPKVLSYPWFFQGKNRSSFSYVGSKLDDYLTFNLNSPRDIE